MKAVRLCVFQMFSCMRRDMMLFAAGLAPILAGLFFKLAVPFLEAVLTNLFGKSAVIAPYYKLIDVFYAMLSPTMFCFAAAMVALEEKDEKTAVYFFITPLGKFGYLISRFGVSSLAAFFMTVLFLPFFNLSQLSFTDIVYLAVSGTLQGIIIALLVVTLSSNKLEGVAVTKLSSLVIFGAVIPFFVDSKMQYLLSLLPSFWIGKASFENEMFFMFPAIILSAVWISLLLVRYLRKL